MTADILREAAAKMRERAEAATPGPWRTRTTAGCEWVGFDDTAGFFRLFERRTWATPGDAQHIASWHPDVALAVADWLDAEAAIWEALNEIKFKLDEKGGIASVSWGESTQDQAVAVARAYLGGDA